LKLKIAEHCCSISFFKLCHISHENENDNGMPVQKKRKKKKKKKMIKEWQGFCVSHRIFGKPSLVTRRIKFKNRPQRSSFLEESLQGKFSG
jgi:hypothetical protein